MAPVRWGRALTALVVVVATGVVALPAGAKDTQKLHGVVTIEFPDYERTSTGCRADRFGSAAKLKKGNAVLVSRGVTDGPGIDVGRKPIARGKVVRGAINGVTDDCDVAFTVAALPVLPPDEFYVVEVRGIATTQTVSATRVKNGDLGPIPASI